MLDRQLVVLRNCTRDRSLVGYRQQLAVQTIGRTRRRIRFSLRFLLALLTAFGIWLGLQVRNARQQRDAVNAIVGSGGGVAYDWQKGQWIDAFDTDQPLRFRTFQVQPVGRVKWLPESLRALLGEEFFQSVVYARMHASSIDRPMIERLQKLHDLDILHVIGLKDDDTTIINLRQVLPEVKVFGSWPAKHAPRRDVELPDISDLDLVDPNTD